MSTADCFSTIELRFKDWNYDHPKVLYGLMRALKPQVSVETGTYRGYAACYMARAIQENNCGRLYCIDNFSLQDHVCRYGDPESHWHDNLVAAGVRDWVVLLKGSSKEVKWPEKVDFVYIDGWHSYNTCMWEFEKATKLGATCICLDDTNSIVGPRMVVDEIKKRGDPYDAIHLPNNCGLSIFMKRVDPRPVPIFSQEIPDHVGVFLNDLTPAERKKYFEEAKKYTGLDYQ